MMIGARLIPLLFPMLAQGAEGEGEGFSLMLGDALAETPPLPEGMAEVGADPTAIMAEPAPELVPPDADNDDEQPEDEETAEAPAEVEGVPFWWPEPPPAPTTPNVAPNGETDAPPVIAAAKAQPQAPDTQATNAAIPDLPTDPTPTTEVAVESPVQTQSQPPPIEIEPARQPTEPPAPPKTEQPADTSLKRAPPPMSQMAEAPPPDLPAQNDELGQIQVMFEREGEATRITLVAERAETVDLMRRNADQLQNELSREGLADADLNFAERQQGKQHRGGHASAEQEAAIIPLPPTAPQTGLDLRL